MSRLPFHLADTYRAGKQPSGRRAGGPSSAALIVQIVLTLLAVVAPFSILYAWIRGWHGF